MDHANLSCYVFHMPDETLNAKTGFFQIVFYHVCYILVADLLHLAHRCLSRYSLYYVGQVVELSTALEQDADAHLLCCSMCSFLNFSPFSFL